MSRGKEGRGVASEYNITGSMDPAKVKALQKALTATGHEAKNQLRHDLKKAGLLIKNEGIDPRTPVYKGKSYSGGRGARRASVEVRGASGASKTYKGTHTPGLLKRSTRVKTYASLKVQVYNNAKAVSRKWPGGYRYGKRIEFDPKLGGRFAFFYPGYEAVKDRAVKLFNETLKAAAKAYVR